MKNNYLELEILIKPPDWMTPEQAAFLRAVLKRTSDALLPILIEQMGDERGIEFRIEQKLKH